MKISIDLPDRLPFSTEIDVCIGDINYGQHLGNDAVLRILHEARLRFLKRHNFSEADAGGAALIMADAAIVFKSQAFHADRLTVTTGIRALGRCGFEMPYRIRQFESGRDVAFAQTGLIFFDYKAGRVVRVPEVFRTRMIEAGNLV